MREQEIPAIARAVVLNPKLDGSMSWRRSSCATFLKRLGMCASTVLPIELKRALRQ
jgi:hypothetical protein